MDGLRKPLADYSDRELDDELTRRRRLRARGSGAAGASSASGGASSGGATSASGYIKSGASSERSGQELGSSAAKLSSPITPADRRALERLEREMGLGEPPARLPTAMPGSRVAEGDRESAPRDPSIALSLTDEMARHYAALELGPGASFNEVQRRYREMLEKYHPDKHAGDPDKHRAAIQLAQELTRAYQALSERLRQRF